MKWNETTKIALQIKREILLAVLTLALASSIVSAQDWNSTAGLLQGEHIARVTTLMEDTLRAEADTTAWLAFGTHTAALAGERKYNPSRFTAFVKVDTAGVSHASTPSITLEAELALSDTNGTTYVQYDNSLSLISATYPLTSTIGQAIPVPVYGGGWIRFIVSSADSAEVKLDVWLSH